MKAPAGPLAFYLATRAVIWIAAAFALLTFDSLTRVFGADEQPWTADVGWFVDMWSRWDGSWFVGIARDGYVEPEDSAAFFPLYPMLVRGLGTLLGDHYVLAGVLVSPPPAPPLSSSCTDSRRRSSERTSPTGRCST